MTDLTGLLAGDRLVFIGGLHRSGTSLVHRCLSDHADVSGFQDTGVPEDEGQHLQSVYVPADRYGGPGVFGFRPESYLDESSHLVTSANAERLLTDWLRFWDRGRRILIEKSPANLLRARFLQALYPECRFVMVLRHPIAVGYATQKWTSMMPVLRQFGLSDRRQPKIWIHTLIEHWLYCHEIFERDRAHLRNVHVVRYEDFVQSPQDQLADLFRFLGLPPAALQREVRPAVSDRYWEKWVRRREGPLSRMYAERTISEFEERVGKFGYSLLRV